MDYIEEDDYYFDDYYDPRSYDYDNLGNEYFDCWEDDDEPEDLTFDFFAD